MSNTKPVPMYRNVSATSIISTPSISDCDEFDYLFPDITDIDEIGSFSDSMDSPQSTPGPMGDIDYDDKSSRTQSTPSPPTRTDLKQHEEENLDPMNMSMNIAYCNAFDDDTADAYHYNSDNCNVLICLDWDDTLHPTSALKSKLPIECVRRFCLAVYETLLTLIRLYGASSIFIVSNADKLWIQQCLNTLSASYFVNIYHLISLYNIQIISAKNEFSKIYPNDSLKWKQLTFEHLVKKHYAKSAKNNKKCVVVSIGDSQHEYIASERVIERLNSKVTEHGKKIVLHRMKLLENPTLDHLIIQYQLIQKLAVLFGKQVNNAIDIDYLREMRYFINKHQ